MKFKVKAKTLFIFTYNHFIVFIGEVWAVILYDVYWNLVEKHGFQADWFDTSAEKLGGNVIMVQLVIDGMKLQPCDPNFIEARDAIIQADQINNGGENECELWRGFAKRGLGPEATSNWLGTVNESFDLPSNC